MEFTPIIADAFREGACLQLVLSRKANGSDVPYDKLTVRPVIVRGQTKFQFATRTDRRQIHENLDAEQAIARIERTFGPVFLDCRLFTPDADYSARVRRDGRLSVKKKAPTKSTTAGIHDRRKNYLLPDGEPCPFLIEIGIMTPSGKVKAAKYQKFRQINRFLELVDDTLPHLPASGRLNVVDFGCGKSYLTFALHHLLTAIRGREVNIVGLDREETVISECARVTAQLGCKGLRFEVGDIADHEASEKVDMAVSLHACDTATDLAIAKAVDWQADVILAVPCCQHEVARMIRSETLSPVLDRGILKDRFAAIVTDAMRAQCLEICGYRTQVVEFIDMEHTAKNILIRAIRTDRSDRSVTTTSSHAVSYRRLKKQLGLDNFCLEAALGKKFTDRIGHA